MSEIEPTAPKPFESFTLEELGGRDYNDGIPGYLPGWEEMRAALGDDLDAHLRFFHPIEYARRDPALIERYQDITHRLEAHMGEPFMGVSTLEHDSYRIDMGLVDNSELVLDNFGRIYVTTESQQWIYADIEDGSVHAENSQSIVHPGSVPIENRGKRYCDSTPIWQKERRPASHDPDRLYIDEELLEVFIGQEQVDAFMAANPGVAPTIADMLRAYRTGGINMAVATSGMNDDLFLSGATEETYEELTETWEAAGGALGKRYDI